MRVTQPVPLPLRPGAAQHAAQRALRGRGPGQGAGPAASGVYDSARAWAEAEPELVAVVANGQEVTYADLDRRVRQFHAALLRHGCAAGEPVGVVGPRHADSIAVVLALEALGLVYVPIDPAWPAPRVSSVVHNASLRIVLSVGESAATDPAARTAAAAGVTVVAAPDPSSMPSAVLGTCAARPDDPRYVIHTSGSTGSPKGAVVTHLGLMNHLQSMVDILGLRRTDTVAFSAPTGYVISVWQMLAALLVGARIAIVDDADLQLGRRLARAVARARITVLELVPTAIGWLVADVARTGAATALRCLISTGERLDSSLAGTVLRALPEVALYNAYGTTECSDDVAVHRVVPADVAAGHIPAGVPVHQAVLYLLVRDGDEWRAAGPDEPGELFVGGASVGRGYLDNNDVMVARFFTDSIDPHSPSGRLYRTGDVASVVDGLLRCHGRVDRQVKIAGVRIELGEVESVIAQVGGVRRCAVVAHRREGRDELTVHYVADTDVVEVETYALLQALLPAPAVPRRWIRHGSLPTNASGKIDYGALPSE